MSVIVGEDIARDADNERVIKRYSGGIVPPDDNGNYVRVHRDDYVSHDYARKLIAQTLYKTEGSRI
ncbi:hypothetical protein BSK66_07935 [Paenibacillus odorifer]|uniref:hypothetical protein n=1 Tax=Paenibacillus TaxID=44249 RepID=UPI0003E20E8E|nr:MULTISPECIES: hypothetical protein [Paenibacillus]ETT64933.1 hypothetical protein C171_07952 [Paenibacillus sp. FSL H8-237]OME61051.1 hypothetical protein BSK66_07935 [Paenibacillus odorifer]